MNLHNSQDIIIILYGHVSTQGDESSTSLCMTSPLLHRCVNLTQKKTKHEEALELANEVRNGLLSFEARWRDGRYAEIRDAATDIFENLFDLVDLCNGLIEEKKADAGQGETMQEALF